MLVDEPSVGYQREPPIELRGRYFPFREDLQRVDSGERPGRAGDPADDDAARRVGLRNGPSQRRRGAIGLNEHPGESLGCTPYEEDTGRFPDLLHQCPICDRPPIVDSELGRVDGKGKKLGERAVALQGASGELAVELRSVARGGDDDQIGRVLRDSRPDVALVESKYVADQDERPRPGFGDSRPQPAAPQARNDQEKHRPHRPADTRRNHAEVRNDARHRRQPPRPVMRAYSRGSTDGRAPGRENTA